MKAGAGAGALLLVLAGCSGNKGENEMVSAAESGSAGARLEAAALAQGLVPDPAASMVGAWARDTDRACIVDAPGGVQRIGIVSDYGDGQDCSGSGVVERTGETLRIALGECRVEARTDGERIIFPGEVPATCASLCRGRASLAGFAVERASDSASEAATLRGRRGRKLCG